jgi:hypothetical protein
MEETVNPQPANFSEIPRLEIGSSPARHKM